jgi:hypothetical protein
MIQPNVISANNHAHVMWPYIVIAFFFHKYRIEVNYISVGPSENSNVKYNNYVTVIQLSTQQI